MANLNVLVVAKSQHRPEDFWDVGIMPSLLTLVLKTAIKRKAGKDKELNPCKRLRGEGSQAGSETYLACCVRWPCDWSVLW